MILMKIALLFLLLLTPHIFPPRLQLESLSIVEFCRFSFALSVPVQRIRLWMHNATTRDILMLQFYPFFLSPQTKCASHYFCLWWRRSRDDDFKRSTVPNNSSSLCWFFCVQLFLHILFPYSFNSLCFPSLYRPFNWSSLTACFNARTRFGNVLFSILSVFFLRRFTQTHSLFSWVLLFLRSNSLLAAAAAVDTDLCGRYCNAPMMHSSRLSFEVWCLADFD